MSLSIDPAATLLALIALTVAAVAYRASCCIWLKLLSVSGGATSTVEVPNLDFFNHLDILIRNLGIPLHDVKVWLCFDCEDGDLYQIEFRQVQHKKPYREVHNDAVFQQGMVGAYSLRSYDFDENHDYGLKLIRKLNHPRKRNARIRIYSQAFLVWEIRIWQRFYWLKLKWNSLAHWVNSKFNRKFICSDGRELLKEGKVLPTFNTNSNFRLECFVRDTIKYFERRNFQDSNNVTNQYFDAKH